ncbi:MAG TPA: nuclear transport factor 2 family protein [Solirubrobacteraceae bacterium]|nr:nuclear transport factor 2 family protein [Solirubrobacteraceae bacterium]
MSGSPLGGSTFMSVLTPGVGGLATPYPPDVEVLGSTPRSREWMARHLFDAFNQRDLEKVLALIHPDMVFETVSGAVVANGEPYRGRDGMRQYMADVATHWFELTVRPLQVRAAGEAVVALGEVDGRGPAGTLDGVSTTWVLKFRDGLVVHAQVFSEVRHARRALGQD